VTQAHVKGPQTSRQFLFLGNFVLGYRGIVQPPSDDEGTERTWFDHQFW